MTPGLLISTCCFVLAPNRLMLLYAGNRPFRGRGGIGYPVGFDGKYCSGNGDVA